MMKEAAGQFDELCEIRNIEERVNVACEKFSKCQISAKAVRMLWDKLDSKMKMKLIDGLYAKDVRKDNARRLPPDILMPKAVFIEKKEEIDTWGTLLKYYLINNYEKSKNQDSFMKLKDTLNNFYRINFTAVSLRDREGNFSYKDKIYSIAIKSFMDELMQTEKEYDTAPLNLPSSMTMGVELEFVGVSKNYIQRLVDNLKWYGVDYLNEFTIKSDMSVKKNGKTGAEVVSPILEDSEVQWEKLRDACRFIQVIGGAANKTCGGHVHIGANTLGLDKKAWEYFLKVWAEAEPLMYMISNRRGEKTRKTVPKYAKLTNESINQLDFNSVKIRNEDDLNNLAHKVSRSDRYKGLNLINIHTYKKNTIEFRLANGSVDYNIWRENILLYGRLVQMAKMRSLDSKIKKKEYDRFFEPDLPEREKITRLLDLIFDDEKEKEVYMRRWQYRAGEEPVFGEKNISTYKRQVHKEPIKKQIKEVCESVEEQDRIEAMHMLIDENMHRAVQNMDIGE